MPDPALGDDVPLGNAQKTTMLTSTNGIKIGIIGIVEREWLDTINSLPPNLKFLPADQVVQDLAKDLREQGAEMIIALTHQREPNDMKLAEALPPHTIDLMLGGHDHFYAHAIINGIHLLRSGTDFKQLSYLEAWRSSSTSHASNTSQPRPAWDVTITRRDITRSIEPDRPTMALVDSMTSALRQKMAQPVGYTTTPLDARFRTVRTAESNIANFVADLMRIYYNADVCILVGGTIRGDQVYGPGVLRMQDIMDCFPFEDPCVVLRVSGKAVWDALEKGVSTYPALEGRFPQVGGMSFTFDAGAPPGKRIVRVSIAGAILDHDKMYTLVTRGYTAHGKDGFESLRMASEGGPCEELVSEENGLLISALLRQYFMSLKVLGRWKRWSPSLRRAWGDVQEELHELHPVRGKGDEESAGTVQQASPSKSEVQGRVEGHDGEVQKRKEEEATALSRDGGFGAAAHGGEQHQGSDLVSTALQQSSPPSASQPPTQTQTSAPSDHSSATHFHASDSEDDALDAPTSSTDLPATAPSDISAHDRRKILARKACRKWWKAVGMKGHPGTVDDEAEEDWGKGGAEWTRGIAPKVEGRIVMVGGEDGGKRA